MTSYSLRGRLILIILTPLMVIALVAGVWQFRNTTRSAESIFDRGLLSAALAISRDIAVSDGDALSPATRRLINDTSGGVLFYHVFAPDGVFVTGYSTPPVLPKSAPEDSTEPFYYNARYQGEDVRVLRFQDGTTVSGITGVFNITVWQNADVRSNFVREVVSRSFAVIVLLVVSVAFVVWFGVARGLRPLLDLEQAIALRSPSELDPIMRPVPIEARGLVNTLNDLLDRVSRRISSKDEFIANAAHQLRNPVAGVIALAEAVQNARTPEAVKERCGALVQAAREASNLTNQLLSFERAGGSDDGASHVPLDFGALVDQVVHTFRQQNMDHPIDVQVALPRGAVIVPGNAVMLQEAILNLLRNAVVHGGANMRHIKLDLKTDRGRAILSIQDDGIGIPADKHVEAISRFSQVNDGPGSGLGLPIAARVMKNHAGFLDIMDPPEGALIVVTLPLLSNDAMPDE